LSQRLQCVCDMVTKGHSVADVGCDHGFVSIYLVHNNISPKALCMDVNEGPLLRAAMHIKEYKLSKKITTRLSNGLREYVKGESDTLIIAGMGGPLMQDILSYEKEKTDDFMEMILSPQSQIKEFRMFLYDNGYEIADESMVKEDDKFYVIIKALKAPEKIVLPEEEYSYGPVLLKKKDMVLKEYLDKEFGKHNDILCKLKEGRFSSDSDRIDKRIEAIKNDIIIIEKALGYYGG